MLLLFYECSDMRVHLFYNCYHMRRKKMESDSDSLQNKHNHQMFNAKQVWPHNMYMLINISVTNMANGQY